MVVNAILSPQAIGKSRWLFGRAKRWGPCWLVAGPGYSWLLAAASAPGILPAPAPSTAPTGWRSQRFSALLSVPYR